MDVWFILLVGAFILMMMLVLTQLYSRDFMKYLPPWTGLRYSQDLEQDLKGYEKVQVVKKTLDPEKKKQTVTYELQSGKTLWDWLQLLLIPVVLASVAYLFNSYQSSTSQQLDEQNKQEQVVDSYLNQMSTILLQYHLHDSKPNDPIRALAQAISLTALDRLDNEHKSIIVLFLYRADLLKYHYYNHNETECGNPGVLKKQFLDEKPIITLSQGQAQGVTISNLGLACIDLHNMYLQGSNFSKSDLDRADLGLSSATNSNFSNASLIAANLYFLDLANANLQGAHMQSANMKGICLSHAQLDGADLEQANLSLDLRLIAYAINYCGKNYKNQNIPADLSNASLTNANLAHANLIGADLTDANLSGANLTYANLTGANLTGANLVGANLSHATVSQEQLAEAITHDASSIPAGSKP